MKDAGTGNNSTYLCQDDPSWRQTGSYFQIIGYCLIVVPLSTLVLNSAEIALVCTAPKLKTHTRFFLVSLAFCDILTGLTVMPFNILGMVSDVPVIFGETGCNIGNSLDLMLLATSVLHMCVLALDRCVASVRPFQLGYWFGRKYGSLIFATCWILPATLTFGFIIPKFHTVGLENRHMCSVEHAGSCRLLANVYYSILFTIFAFLIPSIFVSTCTRYILRALNRRQQMFMKLSHLHTKRGSFYRRYFGTTLAHTILTLTSYSFIFLLPFFTVYVLDPFISYKIPHFVWIIVTWFRYARSAVNPILYMKGTKILSFRAFYFT